METARKFTLDELRKFDGKEGRPAYVAHKGKVYDVTESSQWIDGDHIGHAAGEDKKKKRKDSYKARKYSLSQTHHG